MSILLIRSFRSFCKRKILSFDKWQLVSSKPKFSSNIEMENNHLNPPSVVTGMKSLNKDLFKKTVKVPCVLVESKDIKTTSVHLKKFYLRLPNLRPMQGFDELNNYVQVTNFDSLFPNVTDLNLKKVALLDPHLVTSFKDLSSSVKDFISETDFSHINITIGYDNWNGDKILRAIIPPELNNVTSYSLIGHIVHLNLREELKDYKQIIAEVLLGKIKQARTIVNKAENIDSTYRNFKMEKLLGSDDMVTRVKENNCTFEFDFSTVFWNPRLSSEHQRIVDKLKKGDVLYDVFAGVGPFAIPAAKKGCKVFANDLNPDSTKWLATNCKLNKVEEMVKIYNMDGAEFIRDVFKLELLKSKQTGDYNIHVTMNLPALAPTFLPNFKGLLTSMEVDTLSRIPIPILHVYCFAKGLEEPQDLAKILIQKELSLSIDDLVEEITFVRNVAPNKDMMRVTISLTGNLLGPCAEKRPLSPDQEMVGAKKVLYRNGEAAKKESIQSQPCAEY